MNPTHFPRPAVTVAAVAQRDGRFLVVEEHDNEGRLVINQPAGHLEAGEDILVATAREALEETGWTFRPEFLLGVYLWQHQKGHSYLRLAFGGEALEHDPTRPLDDGILHALWLTPEELAARGDQLRSPLVLQCVRDYQAGIRHPLSAVQSYVNP